MTESPLILIVDDDSSLSHLYSVKLTSEGFSVITAQNGKEGYDKAVSENPDLILLDLKMPVMDGVETLVELRANEKTKKTKIIILSSFNEWSSMKMSDETAKAIGAEDFIEKDIDLDELVGRIRTELKRTTNEN